MNWLDIVKMIAPIVIRAKVKHGDMLAPLVAAGIEHAESIPGAKGAAKLNASMTVVNDGIDALNIAKPGAIDKAAVNLTLADATSVVVDVAKLIQRSVPPAALSDPTGYVPTE